MTNSIKIPTKVAIEPDYKKTSRFVNDQLITPLKEEHGSRIGEFLKAYYDWMDNPENGIGYDINHLHEYTSVNFDTKFTEFLDKEILPLFPNNIKIDKTLLRKHAKSIYQSRGSEESIKTFFRLLYDTEISVSYPSEELLIVSGGEWVKETKIRTTVFNSNLATLLSARQIKGVNSSSTAYVESVIVKTYGSTKIADITLSNVIGYFEENEIIKTIINTNEAVPLAERIYSLISSATINNGGSGYSAGELITTTGGDGNGLIAVVGSVDENGTITSVAITDPGINYTVNPINDNFGSGTNADIYFNISGQFTNNGVYVSEKSRISYGARIRDDGIYQEYSYVIESDITVDTFKEPLLKLIHPSGINVVGNFRAFIDKILNSEILFHISDINTTSEGKRKFIELYLLINSKDLITESEFEYLTEKLVINEQKWFDKVSSKAGLKEDVWTFYRNVALLRLFLGNITTNLGVQEIFKKSPFIKYSSDHRLTIEEIEGFGPDNYNIFYALYAKNMKVDPSETFMRVL